MVRVVTNPVNLRQAIAAPFKRIGAQLSSTAERITSSAETQLQAQVSQATTSLETGVKEGITAPQGAGEPAPPSPTPQGHGMGRMRDWVLAGGVAVSALGASFAFIAKTLNDLGSMWWLLLAALAAGLTIVLVPTILIAWFKLRRRNLSAVLEASGWAINAPMRLTRRLRRLIVQIPSHPKSFLQLREDMVSGLLRKLRDDD